MALSSHQQQLLFAVTAISALVVAAGASAPKPVPSPTNASFTTTQRPTGVGGSHARLSASLDDSAVQPSAIAAMSILIVVAMLICIATLVDYKYEDATLAHVSQAAPVVQLLVAQQVQLADCESPPPPPLIALRDERSPSLSSSLFSSSTNSLRSASSPILGSRQQQQQQPLKSTSCLHGRPLACSGAAQTSLPVRQAPQTTRRAPLSMRLLLAFSARANSALLFNEKQYSTKQSSRDNNNNNNNNNKTGASQTTTRGKQHENSGQPQSVDALHGIRFLSMTWIIALHSYAFALRWLKFDTSDIGTLSFKVFAQPAMQVLANGTFACDTFLLAGGFLVAHCALAPKSAQAMRKRPLATLTTNLIHRYVRMAPLMMAVIGLSATLLRFLAASKQSSAHWANSTMMFDGWCRANWWKNALFVQNLIGTETMCLSHSWYSAVDMQLFVVAQVLLASLIRFPRLLLASLAGLGLMSQLTTATLTYSKHLPPVPLIPGTAERAMLAYFTQIYIMPTCRAAPYLIGFALAYCMQTTRLSSVKLSARTCSLAWICASVSMLIVLFCMLPAFNQPHVVPSKLVSAIYSSLSRPIWALSVGWIVFACATNNCWPIVASLLGAKMFVPLSRLTYPAFLVHPILMAIFYGRSETVFNFSHLLMVYFIIGNLVLTYIVSYFLALAFELPMQMIERELRAPSQQSIGSQKSIVVGCGLPTTTHLSQPNSQQHDSNSNSNSLPDTRNKHQCINNTTNYQTNHNHHNYNVKSERDNFSRNCNANFKFYIAKSACM